MDLNDFKRMNQVIITKCENNHEEMIYEIFEKKRSSAPFYYSRTPFDIWRNSFFTDIDFDGQRTFIDLKTYVLLIDGKCKGFIQFGMSSFVFGEKGKDYTQSYGVVRNFYFDGGTPRKHVSELLKISDDYFEDHNLKTTYAYFHYFGMSCYVRQGKLHESEFYIQDELIENNYSIEHENVYYTKEVVKGVSKDLDLELLFRENNTIIDFVLDDGVVGQCELDYIKTHQTTFMRWIGIKKEFRGQGYGSKCLKQLLHYLAH